MRRLRLRALHVAPREAMCLIANAVAFRAKENGGLTMDRQEQLNLSC